jgi:hypothetical protein
MELDVGQWWALHPAAIALSLQKNAVIEAAHMIKVL